MALNMRKIYICLSVITALFLTGCHRGYKVENDKVYYEYWNEGSGQGKWLIKNADAKTFQKMDLKCDGEFDFGKDKNHLFINGETIRNIDPNSFRFIGNYVFADKDSLYFFGAYNNIQDCAIKGVKPGNLQLIKYPWSKTGNILIHWADTLTLDDINDFIPIDEHWGKTKKHVINDHTILPGADPQTFKVINTFTGKDQKNTYEFGKVVK
jgi:hypothetical protein